MIQDSDSVLREVDLEKKNLSLYSTPKNFFMKQFIFSNEIEAKIYEINKEILKYFKALWLASSIDGSINMQKFRNFIGINDANFSRLKKKLFDNNIIVEEESIYYLNPIIYSQWEKVLTELYNRFRVRNEKLYWIREI